MKTLGYYNGEIGEIDDMKIPMNDRVCWFGDGIYDATAAIDHKVLFVEEHVERFFNSAAMLKMTVPMSKAELAALLNELVRKVDSPLQFVYWQLTRGTANRGHAFPRDVSGNYVKANLWVMLRPTKEPDLEKKRKLIIVEDTRFFHCNAKTLNLIPNIMAAEQAELAGADEAVFYRKNWPKGDGTTYNRVTECAHSNVHILKDGVFRTGPLDNLILPGIARAHILTQSRGIGVTTSEEPFSIEELLAADEIFTSSSLTFLLPVSHVDGKPVGGKAPDIVKKIQKAVMDEAGEYIKKG